MNHILTTLIFSSFFFCAMGQKTLKTVTPKEKFVLDVSMKSQKEMERRNLLLGKRTLTKQEQNELDVLLKKHDETIESVWDIIGTECSWYCGGGNYAIKASSSLSRAQGSSYVAKRANDLSYQSAWVEGKEGDGTGEYLEYYFKNNSPRITQIIISNGYVKSETVWRNNNRVKKLKLYVNGEPYRILQLDDSRDDQVFEVGTLGRNKNGTDLVLRFEILAVYKGDKYNDTAISEIYFDGIDVH
jgi:hypothetical protein